MTTTTGVSLRSLSYEERQAAEELQMAAMRIAPLAAAERLWNRYLSPQDRERLGGDLATAYVMHRTAGMWVELRGVTLPRAVVEVAKLLGFLREEDYEWLLRAAGETVNAEEAMENAIADGDLVLVERPREAYWNGEPIDIDWDQQGASWAFLWELARCSKAGQPIDRFTFGERSHCDVVTKRKSRLSNMPGFPIDLADLIEPAAPGSQQLTLPREQIRVFMWTGVDTLSEWTP